MKWIGQAPIKLWCVTVIDPTMGWFKMKQIANKEPITIANVIETTWLTRYPWPDKIVYDRGSEFLVEFAEMIKEDYHINKKPITIRNPQANSILERVHQMLSNIV